MEADDDISGREAFEQIFSALFVAGGEVAKQLPPVAGSPEIQGGLAVVLSCMGFATGRGLHRVITSRREAFAKGYMKAFDDDPGKATEHAAAHAEDADYHETMYRAFKHMLDAADPSVVPTLGYLAGQYSHADMKPDGFFRGLGRLLCDLEAGELPLLTCALRAIQEANQDEKDEWLDVVAMFKPGNGSLAEEVVALVHTANSSSELGIFSGASRLFALLKRERLAEDMSMVDETERLFPGGDQAMYISADMVRRILRTLDPKPIE